MGTVMKLQEYFDFLDALREGGSINMFGAPSARIKLIIISVTQLFYMSLFKL